jgi:hypothetical protein
LAGRRPVGNAAPLSMVTFIFIVGFLSRQYVAKSVANRTQGQLPDSLRDTTECHIGNDVL